MCISIQVLQNLRNLHTIVFGYSIDYIFVRSPCICISACEGVRKKNDPLTEHGIFNRWIQHDRRVIFLQADIVKILIFHAAISLFVAGALGEPYHFPGNFPSNRGTPIPHTSIHIPYL